jgi:hypothetical protein
MLHRSYLRSIARPAILSHPKRPSCGTQPAHFRVDTRRYDTLDTTRGLIRPTKRRYATTVVAAASPCPLDKIGPISDIPGS